MINSTHTQNHMTDQKLIWTELEKFGLSRTQAEIYLLLVAHKQLRVQEIVRLSKIPRSTVYACLKGLYELGIAEEVIDDNFKRIKPYSIGAMRHGLDEKLLQVQRLLTDLDTLEKTITSVMPETPTSDTTVRYYKGRSGARQLYWNTLKATGTVYVMSDWGRGRYVGMRYYENFVAESRRREIQEKVLINPTPHAIESIKQYSHPGSPISRTKIEDIRAIDTITIKGDTLMYDQTYACAYLKGIEINGFEIESAQFSETQRSIFEALWQTATPITELLHK
jgi:sugar-specific transcriptional regulator TrmB